MVKPTRIAIAMINMITSGAVAPGHTLSQVLVPNTEAAGSEIEASLKPDENQPDPESPDDPEASKTESVELMVAFGNTYELEPEVKVVPDVIVVVVVDESLVSLGNSDV